MKVLYLTEDYIGSMVHHNLCQAIATTSTNIDLTLFLFERPNYGLRDLRSMFNNLKYKVVTSVFCGNMLLFKTFFPYKVRVKSRALAQSIDISEFDFVVASTLFSDGAVALRLWKRYKIPYIVVVRGTDVNLYLKYMPYLNGLGRAIVANAQKVVFVAPRQYNEFCQSSAFRKVLPMVQQKTAIITNGIDNEWLTNTCFDDNNRNTNSVLDIGAFDANKNVQTLIAACKEARKQNAQLQLNLVGGGGACHNEIIQQVAENSDWITFHGAIYDKAKLRQICRANAVFAMVSVSETFGLVYFEALSQGLPVIYTKNQGFDGFFTNLNVGYAVAHNSVGEIAEKINLALQNRLCFVADIKKINFGDFCWQQKAYEWIKTIKHND